MKVIIAAAAALLLGACSTFVPINYVPATPTRGSGNVEVGAFTYQPYVDGKVKANQFQKKHPSIGEKYTNGTVSEVVVSALRKELAYAGYTPRKGSPTVISGNVTRFYDDWVGFSKEHIEVNITFNVSHKGSVVYTYKAHARVGEAKGLVENTNAVQSALSKCIDAFLKNAQANGAL